jgi:GNAT superfamily N-acetyltransferase
MWLAFRGGVDDEYSGPGDADADAAGALAGRWGPVVWQASLAAELESALVAAVIIVLDDAHEGLPLLAFVMTDPVFQRRGIGQRLIGESIHRLDATGVKGLHLAVTRGNPAFGLYQRLGFEVVPGRRSESRSLRVTGRRRPGAGSGRSAPCTGGACAVWTSAADGGLAISGRSPGSAITCSCPGWPPTFEEVATGSD